jgi:hypothetical protein
MHGPACRQSIPSRVRLASPALAFLAWFAGVPGAVAEPLITLNQNPLTLPYSLPMPLPARLPQADTSRATLEVNWSNSANADSSGSYDFTLDAETVDVRLRLEHSFSDRWAGLVELPWRSLSGGTLDGLIENWHNLFGLPQGPRKNMPKDRLLIDYQRNGVTELHIEDSGSGIADIPVRVGYQLHASDTAAVSGWLTVDLPTGDTDLLLGNGATDGALSLAGQVQLAEKWQLFGQADAIWLGNGDILPQYQQNYVIAGLAGVSWNAWRALDLTVQCYANTKVFDVGVNGLAGEAVVLSFGGTWRTQGGWRIDLGMNEDIQVEASPDATFYLLFQKGF